LSKWILIIYIGFGSGGGPAVIEFSELSECEKAGLTMCQGQNAKNSRFGTGLKSLVAALNTDVDWVREHTRYLQRAIEWDRGGKPANRLLSGDDIAPGRRVDLRMRPNSQPSISTSSVRVRTRQKRD
jgi:hypothetical protein